MPYVLDKVTTTSTIKYVMTLVNACVNFANIYNIGCALI